MRDSLGQTIYVGSKVIVPEGAVGTVIQPLEGQKDTWVSVEHSWTKEHCWSQIVENYLPDELRVVTTEYIIHKLLSFCSDPRGVQIFSLIPRVSEDLQLCKKRLLEFGIKYSGENKLTFRSSELCFFAATVLNTPEKVLVDIEIVDTEKNTPMLMVWLSNWVRYGGTKSREGLIQEFKNTYTEDELSLLKEKESSFCRAMLSTINKLSKENKTKDKLQ